MQTIVHFQLKSRLLVYCRIFYNSRGGGCAQVATGIEHVKLKIFTKMKKTVFLNPVRPDRKTIFIQAKSTSHEIVQDPYKAHYLLRANVLYMDKKPNILQWQPDLAGSAFGGGSGRL